LAQDCSQGSTTDGGSNTVDKTFLDLQAGEMSICPLGSTHRITGATFGDFHDRAKERSLINITSGQGNKLQ
jgi:hypothetical protein